MSWNQIKELQERRAALAKSAKDILNGAEKENRSMNAEEQVKFDSIMKDADAYELRLKALEQAKKLEDASAVGNEETRSKVKGACDSNDPKEIEAAQHRALEKYIRTGVLSPELAGAEKRDLAKGSEVIGNRSHYATVVEAMKAYAGPLTCSQLIETDHGNTMTVTTSDDTGNVGELVSEAGANTVDSAAAIATKTLGAYKFGSKIFKVSNEMIEDAGFDVVNYVLGMASERLGRTLNTYFTTGTGSSQPEGCAYNPTLGIGSGSTTDFDYDDMVDLFHSVNSAYRNSPKFRWMLSDSVLAKVRKLNTGTGGSYIWSPGAAGEPDKLLGKQYVVNNDMVAFSSLTNGSKVMLAGDFSRFFIRIVKSITLKRFDELYQANGQVGFIAWIRCDSKVIDSAAIKYMRASVATT